MRHQRVTRLDGVMTENFGFIFLFLDKLRKPKKGKERGMEKKTGNWTRSGDPIARVN